MAASDSSLSLYIKWSEKTACSFGPRGYAIPWSDQEPLEVKCAQPPLTIEDISCWIEARVEVLYAKATAGRDKGQCQVVSMHLGDQKLPWGDLAGERLKDGDRIVVYAQLATSSAVAAARGPCETELRLMRTRLRFALNDRVVCNIGARWLSGHVVNTAVVSGGEIAP